MVHLPSASKIETSFAFLWKNFEAEERPALRSEKESVGEESQEVGGEDCAGDEPRGSSGGVGPNLSKESRTVKVVP